jgi:crotonobetainyl-CoA:carnitine CoA-transferase CaiB-like acyl-CoA transferase
VIGIQAALAQRERTGQGQHVDMALLDVMVGVLANQALNYFISGIAPRRMGNAHPNIVPYQGFMAKDGHLMIAVGSDAQFRNLCDVLGRSDLAGDSGYATNASRVAHRESLIAELSRELQGRSRDVILAELGDAGVPAGPINTLTDVFADPQVIARGMRVDLQAPAVSDGWLPGLRTPLRLSQSPLAVGRPAPRLGEHTESVASELGFSSLSDRCGWP